MRLSTLLLLATSQVVIAFVPLSAQFDCTSRAVTSSLQAIAVSVAELEQNLTASEKSITNVVRTCSPSVAFVNSVLTLSSSSSSSSSSNRRKNTNRPQQSNNNNKDGLPLGAQSLGAGSGFVVNAAGYIVTNYHVIERAYMIQKMKRDYLSTIQNITKILPGSEVLLPAASSLSDAQVYVRMMDSTQYSECRIVDVQPDLDICVLKVNTTNTTSLSFPPISFGSSSSLLVGQSVVAIGNPFGLETSVTSGVVSALNREINTSPTQKIQNCIQTDASINPGNSGGPLLSLSGEVIGVNTAIVTTSGSSAGVGFAISSDKVEPVVSNIVRKDFLTNKQIAWLGVTIVKPTTSQVLGAKNWVASVERDSPASKAGIQGLQILSNGQVKLGDCIVAIGGNDVPTFADLRRELEQRKVGEQVGITLENSDGERRVAYLKLETMPTQQQ